MRTLELSVDLGVEVSCVYSNSGGVLVRAGNHGDGSWHWYLQVRALTWPEISVGIGVDGGGSYESTCRVFRTTTEISRVLRDRARKFIEARPSRVWLRDPRDQTPEETELRRRRGYVMRRGF